MRKEKKSFNSPPQSFIFLTASGRSQATQASDLSNKISQPSIRLHVHRFISQPSIRKYIM
jgi:hypothetical protein